MSASSVSRSHPSEIFTHFFPSQSRKNETIQSFIKTLLPLLNQQWYLNTDRILHKIRSFKDQMKMETYEKCLNATKDYLNSRDFSVAGRYEVKKSWFFSGIQSYGETPRFQQLNSGLKALLKEVQPCRASWSESFRACWNGFIDCCSSAVSYTYNNPGKTACTFLALETAALAVGSYQQNSTFDASTSIVPWANSPQSHWSCGSNLVFGLSGTLLTQNLIFITTAGASCMPMAYGQIVNGQIPDQLLNIGDPFSLDINMTELFGGPVTDVMVSLDDGSPLPDWLKAGPMIVGNLATTNALGVSVKDNLAYVADGDAGLKVVDVKKAAQPVLRGSLVTAGATKVAVQNNTAYVAAGSEGLKIIDVSDPDHPIFKSNLTTSFARGIAVKDQLAYVADSKGGMKIIDVSNSSQPTVVGSLATSSAWAVAVMDHFAYVADDVGGLKIVDVNNPIHPTLIGTSPTYVAQGVVVKDNNAYVSDYSYGLRIIDVNRADKPVLRSTLRTTDALEAAINANSVYLADGGGGLKIIDARNVSSPVLKGSLATTFANGIAVNENYGYIADSTGGLKIIDLSSVWEISGIPIASKQKYSLLISAKNNLLEARAKSFTISTDYFPTILSPIISQSVMPGNGLTLLLDVDNLFRDKDGDTLTLNMSLKNSTDALPEFLQLKMKPFIGGYLATSGAVRKVVSRNNFAYLADGVGGFQVVDVSDETHPALKSTIAVYEEAMDVAIQENYAYLADNPYGLKIIDISNPVLPVLKSSLATGGIYGVAVNGNFAYLVGGGVQIVDVRDVGHPVLKGKIATTSAKSAVVQDNYAYVVDSGALRIFDVSNCNNPVSKSSFATTLPNSVTVDRGRAYVVGSDGLIILNVQNVTEPVLMSRFKETLYSSRSSIAVSGNSAYIADSIGGGLKIIDVSDPFHPHLEMKVVTTSAQGVSISGNEAYVADMAGGLKIVDMSNYQFIAQPTHDEGNYELTMTARDPLLASASTSFVLRVEGAPRLMKPLPQQIALVGQPFSCFVPEGTFWDPNNDIITYSTESLASFLTFNPSSATLWGVPSGSDRGEYNITLLATDRITTPTSANWNILVHYPPALNKAMPNQVVDIGRPFTFSIDPHTFIDKEHYSLTYSATLDNLDPLPSWISFDNRTQTFRGTPQEIDKGTLNVLVKVDDGLQGQVTGSFPLTVEHFPLLAKNFSTIYAAIGHPFTLNAFSYFLNGDDLTFSATSTEEFPSNLNFDSDNCRLFGTFQSSDRGIIPFTLTARDVSGGSVSADLNVTVDDYAKVISLPNPPEVTIENRSPQLVRPLLQQTLMPDVASAFFVRDSFTDLDGDELTFSADCGEARDWLTIDPKTAKFSAAPSSYDSATFSIRRYTVGVTAMDPANKTAAGSFDILLEGPSFIQKILTALGWISGFAVASYGYYQKKHLIWNWCRKSKYRQPDLIVSVGQKGVIYKVDYPSNEIKSIVVTEMRDGCCIKNDSCCFDVCKNTVGREFHGGAAIYLFDWLSYNPKTNIFYIEGPSEQYLRESIKIQIIGPDKRIREQVTIRIGEQEQDERSDLPFDIPLKKREPVATFSMSALSSSSSAAVSTRGSLNATKTQPKTQGRNSMKVPFLVADVSHENGSIYDV